MPQGDIIGRMTIELIDNGTSLPTPRVTFNPVGRLTANYLQHYLMHFGSEIEKAQIAERHAFRDSAHGDADALATRRRRS